MGTTLPAPLKPEHGWRENRGEKRQQLGAEPASSRSERLEKDRVCIVPRGSPCPAVPDALLAPLPSPKDGFLQPLPPEALTKRRALLPVQHSPCQA